MKILAVDTATRIGSVALVDNEQFLAETTLEITNMHTARLMPMIHALLQSTGTKIEDVDAFAVGIGPGSFTGVRIGVATVKGLGYALDKPVVGLCTLDAIAYSLRGATQPVCAMLDARRNEVYAAIYAPPSQRRAEVQCLSIAQLAGQLSEPCLLVGNGVQAYRDQIEEFLSARAVCVEPVFGLPRAALLAQLALPRVLCGETDDPMALTPLYVRRPEAEVQYETGRLGKKNLV